MSLPVPEICRSMSSNKCAGQKGGSQSRSCQDAQPEESVTDIELNEKVKPSYDVLSNGDARKSNTVAPDNVKPSDDVVPPDGGWGWVVCFACFMCHALVDGLFYSSGVVLVELLDYYGGSKGETSIILSLSPGVCFLVGPLVAMAMNKFGARAVVVAGSLLSSGSLIMSVFAPNLQFLYFSLGTMLGIGYGMVFLPSIVCVSQYFEKRRALATGVGVSGAGIGTFIFSPITSLLIEAYSWKGAILIQAGIVLNCIACGLVYLPVEVGAPVKDGKLLKLAAHDNEAETKNQSANNSKTLSDSYSKVEGVPASNYCMEKTLCCYETDLSPDDKQLPTSCLPTIDNDDETTSYIDSKDVTSERSECDTNPVTADNANNSQSENEAEKEIFATKSDTILDGNFIEKEVLLSSKPDPMLDRSKTEKEISVLQQLKRSVKSSFNLDIFGNISFCLFFVSTFFYSLGYYIPYVYLPDTAVEAGIDELKAAFLISSIGISNTVGRVVFGFLSDRKWVNRIVLYATSLVICGVGTCFGPLLMSYELLLIYSIVFGLFTGVTISLTSVILSDIVGVDKLADAFGVTNFFAGIGSFFGPPIAGWLYDASGDYVVSYVAAGFVIFLSGAMLYFVPCIDRKPLVDKKLS